MATQTQTTTSETIVPDVSKVERHGYLFGHPIAHSMSPLLHQTVYDGLGLKWSQFPLDSLDVDLFLRLREDPNFYGKFLCNPSLHDCGACSSLHL